MKVVVAHRIISCAGFAKRKNKMETIIYIVCGVVFGSTTWLLYETHQLKKRLNEILGDYE